MPPSYVFVQTRSSWLCTGTMPRVASAVIGSNDSTKSTVVWDFVFIHRNVFFVDGPPIVTSTVSGTPAVLAAALAFMQDVFVGSPNTFAAIMSNRTSSSRTTGVLLGQGQNCNDFICTHSKCWKPLRVANSALVLHSSVSHITTGCGPEVFFCTWITEHGL